jgi:hypothetical protein
MTELNIPKRKKKVWKKVLKWFAAIFLFILLLLFTLPFFYKGKINELIKKELSKQIIAKVDYKDVNLSLLRSFPDLTASIEDFSIIGVGEFEEKTLVKINRFSIDIDVLSLFSRDKVYKIHEFSLKQPEINVIINPDGKANYDIFKDTKTDEKSESEFKLDLDEYSIENGRITYNDLQTLNSINISGLNHKGSGNFSSKVFLLKTKTLIDSVSYVTTGISMLKNAKIDCDLSLNADLDKMAFEIMENKLKINDLVLQSKGKVKKDDETVGVNLSLNAPGNNFKEIFSLVPNAYTKDYKDVEAKGQFKFEAKIDGIYKFDGTSLPNFDINLSASDGYVKYPALKIPVESVNANINVFKQSGNLENVYVNINPLTFSIGGEKFMLKSIVHNLTTDPETQGEIKGTLNLNKISQAFPIQDINQLSGRIGADIKFNVNQSFTKKSLSGTSDFQNVIIKYSDLPLLKLSNASALFYNDKIIFRNVNLQAGKSDFVGNFLISDPFNYTRNVGKITLDINTASKFIDADEWMGSDNSKPQNNSNEDNASMINLLNNKLILKYNVSASVLKFEDYDLKNINAIGSLNNNILTLNNTELLFSGSKMSVNGRLNQIISWALEDKILDGNLNISSPFFDVDKFMGTGETATTTTEEDFTLPDKMNLQIKPNIARMSYTGKDISDMKGNMMLSDQKLSFDNISVKGFGGELGAVGYFDAKTGKTPEYNVNLKLKKLKYEQLYNQVTSFSALLPVVKFINGVFNADLNVKGSMKSDLTPVLESVNALGILETVNGVMQSFPGMNEAAGKLNLPSLNNVKLDNIKGRFEITNGIVKVNPFDVKFDDILFNISGLNKLDKTIEYVIHTKIPRSKLDKIPAGKNVSSGLVFLTDQAKSKGLDINLGEFVNLDILVNGLVFKPKVRIEYKGSEGNAVKKAVEQKAEAVIKDTKNKLENEFDTRKKEAEKKAQEILDSTKRAAQNKAKEVAEDLKKKAQKELENRLDSTTKKKANDVLNQYNPFKKKK